MAANAERYRTAGWRPGHGDVFTLKSSLPQTGLLSADSIASFHAVLLENMLTLKSSYKFSLYKPDVLLNHYILLKWGCSRLLHCHFKSTTAFPFLGFVLKSPQSQVHLLKIDWASRPFCSTSSSSLQRRCARKRNNGDCTHPAIPTNPVKSMTPIMTLLKGQVEF